MNVYEVRHEGHYLGGLSVVVAESEERALSLTKFALVERGLSSNNVYVARKLNLEVERCFVLDDGDY